ncbi:hypothetical protein LJB76_00195 [Clostridia bacterium OttesenSCG-928-O13]|nr:hypothetical protein [Clostridia bacterium OttesenSCG-928-O13]
MDRVSRDGMNYIGYEYMELNAQSERISMYLDGYLSFGWVADENVPQSRNSIKLKRDRKIINKTELTRLQRHFEACMDEIKALEKAKTNRATMLAILVGVFGTAFMAGSVFAVTHQPPLILLTILLGVPGLVGWALPIFLFRVLLRRDAAKMAPLIEAKYDEIYEICEKGNKLLHS